MSTKKNRPEFHLFGSVLHSITIADAIITANMITIVKRVLNSFLIVFSSKVCCDRLYELNVGYIIG